MRRLPSPTPSPLLTSLACLSLLVGSGLARGDEPAPEVEPEPDQTGIGEEIWRGETLVAFSDWELAHIGDPFNDLAQSQGMLNMADRHEIFAHYEQCVGFSVPVGSVKNGLCDGTRNVVPPSDDL